MKEGKRYKFKYIKGKTRKSIGTFKGTLIKEYDNYYLFRNVLGYDEWPRNFDNVMFRQLSMF